MKFTGGDKAERYFRSRIELFATDVHLQVGIPEDAKYPDGTSVAMVALLNEYGGRVNVSSGKSIFGRIKSFFGKMLGKPAKTSQQTTSVAIIPARPFMRTWMALYSPGWPAQMAECMQSSGFNKRKALELMGAIMRDQLKKTIEEFSDPPNAPSTIRKKGFDDPLIDSRVLLNSITYEVK